MDVNFSADFSNNKDQFFKPRQVASPAIRHVSFTVRIRFLRDHSGGSLQAPEPAAITSCAKSCHHRNLRNSRVIQHLDTWLSGLFPALLLCGRKNRINVASAQRGAVLITGLIFLVILTLLGTTALQGTILEERMAGNLRDETLAFQAAEAALRSGERFLEQVTIPEFNGSNGLYHHACFSALNPDTEDEEANEPHSCPPTPNPVAGMAWDADDSREIDVTMDGVANQSRYFIEQLPSVPQMGEGGSAQQSGASLNASMFRIVARGTGGTETAIVLLQSTYQR